MLLLSGELAAVLAGVFALHAVLRRGGVDLGVVHAATTAVVVLLVVMSVSTLRPSLHSLHFHHAANARLSAYWTRRICVVRLGLDARAVAWVESQIPPRARFYYDGPTSSPTIPPGPTSVDVCLRFVLLPRLQTRTLAQARYVLFWGRTTPGVAAAVRLRHGTLRRYSPRYAVATLP